MPSFPKSRRDQLVPIEPTPEMIQAMEDRQIEGATYIAENSIQYALWREVWKAALNAAPGGGSQPVDSEHVRQRTAAQGSIDHTAQISAVPVAAILEARKQWLLERAGTTNLPYPSRAEMAIFEQGFEAGVRAALLDE